MMIRVIFWSCSTAFTMTKQRKLSLPAHSGIIKWKLKSKCVICRWLTCKRSCVKETDDIMIPYNSKRNDSRYFPNEQPFPIATSGGSVFFLVAKTYLIWADTTYKIAVTNNNNKCQKNCILLCEHEVYCTWLAIIPHCYFPENRLHFRSFNTFASFGI